MLSIYNGVQTVFLEKNPLTTVYIFWPCSAHSLNRCGMHAPQSSTVIKLFLWKNSKFFKFVPFSQWQCISEVLQGISLYR